jgi:ATP-dependent Clp protease adaptor protein ClpS
MSPVRFIAQYGLFVGEAILMPALHVHQTTPDVTPEIVEDTALEPLYRVIIFNDDVTPMDFVIAILERIFFIERIPALHIMYTAHYKGLAYVQTLPKQEARGRIGRAQFAAGLEGYPLKFTMEPE